jgi:uncharacterized protein RhaS with RHS repeats
LGAGQGLSYNYFRDYDPAIGRYRQSDPIGLEGEDLSTYAYVQQSPILQVDYFGLFSTGLKGLYCQFSQSSGQFFCFSKDTDKEVVRGTCYAGTGLGRNNPDMQDIYKTGPLPRGWWTIGSGISSALGKPSFRLKPNEGNDVFSTKKRDPGSFLIHANNAADDASEGCVICEQKIRKMIDRYGGGSLQVVR